MNAFVIVENRPFSLDQIIKDHSDYLSDDWVLHKHAPQIRTGHEYNAYLTQISFWNDLIKYDRVLIFQHDSKLLRHGIEEFFELNMLL